MQPFIRGWSPPSCSPQNLICISALFSIHIYICMYVIMQELFPKILISFSRTAANRELCQPHSPSVRTCLSHLNPGTLSRPHCLSHGTDRAYNTQCLVSELTVTSPRILLKEMKMITAIEWIKNTLVMNLKEKQACSDTSMVDYRFYRTICKTI